MVRRPLYGPARLSRAAAQTPPSSAEFPDFTLGCLARIVRADHHLPGRSGRSRCKRTITWKKVSDLKGTEPATQLVDQFAEDIPASVLRNIFGWTAPGRLAVVTGRLVRVVLIPTMFASAITGTSASKSESVWSVLHNTCDVGDLRGCYIGSVAQLVEHLQGHPCERRSCRHSHGTDPAWIV